MSFDLKKLFRQTALVLTLSAAGAGVGHYGFKATHGRLDNAVTPAATEAFNKYELRLASLETRQAGLDSTNDEEAAGKLERAKRAFVTDAVLDTALNETSFGNIAARFNRLSAQDGIVFRSAAENPASMAERNESLADVMLTKNRNETAARVEDCMLAYAKKDAEGQQKAGLLGALVGAALAGSFLLGRATRRKPSGPRNA